MFEKMKLKREIKRILKQIDAVEKKRYRSQAALVQAILTGGEPAEDDTEYFNKYTAQIDDLRYQMHKLQQELNGKD